MKCQNPSCENTLPVRKGWAAMKKTYCSVDCYRTSPSFRERSRIDGFAIGHDRNIGKEEK